MTFKFKKETPRWLKYKGSSSDVPPYSDVFKNPTSTLEGIKPKWIPEIVKTSELCGITKGFTYTLLIEYFAVVCSKAIAWASISPLMIFTLLMLNQELNQMRIK